MIMERIELTFIGGFMVTVSKEDNGIRGFRFSGVFFLIIVDKGIAFFDAIHYHKTYWGT